MKKTQGFCLSDWSYLIDSEKGQFWIPEHKVKEFIKKCDKNDEDLFMKVMKRIHTVGEDLLLLKELIKKDFLDQSKKRDKLAGKKLI